MMQPSAPTEPETPYQRGQRTYAFAQRLIAAMRQPQLWRAVGEELDNPYTHLPLLVRLTISLDSSDVELIQELAAAPLCPGGQPASLPLRLTA